MTKKQLFISEVEKFVDELSDEAQDYFNDFKKEKQKEPITEMGVSILTFMYDNAADEPFSARAVGEGIGKTGRVASGAIQKLVKDDYVEKVGDKPALYKLSELGKNMLKENS